MVRALPVTAPSQTSGTARLGWLDALRGIGATAVVTEHMPAGLLPFDRPYSFSIGTYGVLVFFLVSGYIIPASLEHRGDVRAFWIGRVFRLYPLYLAVIALTLALSWWMPVRDAVPRDLSAVASHLTMLLDAVHMGGVVNTMWTLSYEMVFYLVVTALFVGGVHRRSGLFAICFGVGAVVCGLLVIGPMIPQTWPVYASCALFLAGMACLLTGWGSTFAAYALGLMGLVLLVATSFIPWFSAAILAVMFTGTAIYRWERGTGPLWPVPVTAVLVVVSPFFSGQAGWWWVQPGPWIATIALAAVTFAGAMALRRRRVPRFLTWLGLVSYSLYLVHYPILRAAGMLADDLGEPGLVVQLAAIAVCVGLVLTASWLSYRYVEKPMQSLGRRLARRSAVRA
ncbi:acyltransferase [Microtetraspora sp. NBRC 13810]|uniref:acyltransferase family protein n=1 Tax=Microtetraspora sp. NBRC 13810 TaxID=3030990 RepID=UPI00249F9AC5|nr:acyltransferase [Microtetraspora sp. NBRC 13810]GLW09679.1 acyltransferase [Microtetraspora sp. NBRC 13810]